MKLRQAIGNLVCRGQEILFLVIWLGGELRLKKLVINDRVHVTHGLLGSWGRVRAVEIAYAFLGRCIVGRFKYGEVGWPSE